MTGQLNADQGAGGLAALAGQLGADQGAGGLAGQLNADQDGELVFTKLKTSRCPNLS